MSKKPYNSDNHSTRFIERRADGGDITPLMKLFAERIVKFYKGVARGEYKKPELIAEELNSDLHTVFDNKIIYGGKLKQLVDEMIMDIVSSSNEIFVYKLKNAVSRWSEKFFGISIYDEENMSGLNREELLLDDITSRIAVVIHAESDPNKINFRILLDELRSLNVGKVGRVVFVQMLKRIPKLVENKIRNNYPAYPLEKLNGIFKKLRDEIRKLIKEETGPHNN